MNRFFFISLVFLSACTTNYNTEHTKDLTERIEHRDSLSSDDARNILNQLEVMLTEVCSKAEKELKRGTDVGEVRNALRNDAEYMELARQADVLDSILLNYIDTCHNSSLIRYEYERVLKRNVRRARRAGLN